MPRTTRSTRSRLAAAGLGVVVAVSLGGASLAATAFPSRIDLPDGWFPEGITSNGTTAWTGSLVDGALWEADLRTGEGHVLAAGSAGQMAVGIDYERAHDRLWVAGGGGGSVRVYDASSGALLRDFPVAAGFLNDVVVTREAAYITDSFLPQLIVIPLGAGGALPEAGGAVSLPLSGDIVYDPTTFNVNGIDAAHGWLVVVQSNTGRLYRVDPSSGVAAEITGAYDASFGDGLEVSGTTAWVVRNQVNTVAMILLDGQLTRAVEFGTMTSPDLDVPTTATIAAGSLWAVNARFGTGPTPDTEYWITKLPLRP